MFFKEPHILHQSLLQYVGISLIHRIDLFVYSCPLKFLKLVYLKYFMYF